MISSTLAAPVRVASRRVRRNPITTDERFLELTGGHPLFGTVIQSKQIPRMEHLSDIGRWIGVRSVENTSSELWEFLRDACMRANPGWYQTMTAVWLPQDSRSLEAGVNYFSIVSGFSQIPDASASLLIREGCTEAMLEHPEREFLYLEPFVVNKGSGREFVTRNSCGQLLQFQDRMIARVAHRTRMVLKVTRFVSSKIEQFVRFIAPQRAREKYGLSAEELRNLMIEEHEGDIIEKAMNRERRYLASMRPRTMMTRGSMTYEQAVVSLATPLDTSRLKEFLRRYDPVIAFQVPEFASEFKGRMPLALVAHWD